MASYSIDTTHSEVGFSVRHMVFAKVRGHFGTWTANLQYDAQDPTKSKVDVSVDVASIDTREEKRDGHLKSGDFFDAEKFPKITFHGKRVERAGGDGHYKLTGDLTIRDVTKEITLDVEQTGSGKDPWGNDRLGFSGKGSLNRSDFGLKWNATLETGGVLISEKVDLEFETEVVVGK